MTKQTAPILPLQYEYQYDVDWIEGDPHVQWVLVTINVMGQDPMSFHLPDDFLVGQVNGNLVYVEDAQEIVDAIEEAIDIYLAEHVVPAGIEALQ